MKKRQPEVELLFAIIGVVFFFASCSETAEYIGEKPDRGVVALNIDANSIYVGWRLLKEDPEDISFNIYRMDIGKEDFRKINEEPVTKSTNYIDTRVEPDMGYRYRITTVVNGRENDSPGTGYTFNRGMNKPYISIKLKDDVIPNKIGIADLNGDGAYDFVIQHPRFNTDPWYREGYWRRSPEPYKLDAYSSKGEFLWRYDMGWAIESGTWYAPYLVYDIDGDGKAEIYTKAGEGDPREPDGHVLTGNEYLVKIDGETGNITGTRDWIPRDDFGSYNRWSRNFITLAYLDGENPSLVLLRGTYGIIIVSTLDKNFNEIWNWQSTHEYESYKGKGGHSILVADIDGDGKDELIPGTFALNNDGLPIWQLDLRHNDVGHIANIDPDRPGLEIFYGIESGRPEKNGVCLVDARTGEIIWGYEGRTNHIHGRGMIGNIDPGHSGMECYTGEQRLDNFFLYNAKGELLSDESFGTLSPNAVWWDADKQKEIIVGQNVFKYQADTLLQIEGRVIAVADILGDWREEIITALPGEIRIYSTNIFAENRKVCLMQNRQYRIGVANNTMGYPPAPQPGITNK